MAILKGLAAATVLALGISGATACDDYADELALAEAMNAAKVAQSPIPQPVPSAQIATPVPTQAEPTNVAAAEAKATIESPAGTVRQ